MLYSIAMKSNSAIRCPACRGALIPTALHCDACDLTVTGRFGGNEFASLAEDDLHFLRIFVLCEGRIRDMESALGVSYPTIKARLTQLKETLAAGATPPAPEAVPIEKVDPASPSAAVLRELESGRLTFEQAMTKLKLTLHEKGRSI